MRYRRRAVAVEAWQHDDAGEPMPFWVAQILDHRDRAGLLTFKAGTKVPCAAIGDYLLLHDDGHVAVMDPGQFGVEFEEARKRRSIAAENVTRIGSFGFARGAVVRHGDIGPNMIVVRSYPDVTACVLIEGQTDGNLRLKEFPTPDLQQMLPANTPNDRCVDSEEAKRG